jgi:hypothetical protein
MESIVYPERKNFQQTRVFFQKKEKEMLQSKRLPLPKRTVTSDILHSLLYERLLRPIGKKPDQGCEARDHDNGRNDEIPHILPIVRYNSKRMKSPT